MELLIWLVACGVALCLMDASLTYRTDDITTTNEVDGEVD